MLKQGYSDPQLHRYDGDLKREWYVDFYSPTLREGQKAIPCQVEDQLF